MGYPFPMAEVAVEGVAEVVADAEAVSASNQNTTKANYQAKRSSNTRSY